MKDFRQFMWDDRMERLNRARMEQYAHNWAYYNGEHRPSLRVEAGKPDDNVKINVVRMAVDKGAAFLFGKELTWQLEEGEDTPAEQALDLLWRLNRKMTLLNELAIVGGINGQVFVKMVPEPETPRKVQLVSVLPEYVTVDYDDADISKVYLYRIQWTGKERMFAEERKNRSVDRRQDIRLDDSGQSWSVRHYVAHQSEKWTPDPEHEDFAWNYPWPPIIDCQNLLYPGSYFGLSDIEGLDAQDAINYTASHVARILRYHAHPKTIGKGFSPTQFHVTEDGTLVLDSETAEMYNLEMQSDLSSSLVFLDKLLNWALAEFRIPRIDPANVQVGALSGFALKILYGDLLEKTGIKRQTYGDMIVELNRRLAELLGFGPENYATLNWQSPLPEDHAEAAERDGFDLEHGLASKETVRARRGIDHESELERLQNEQQNEGDIGALLIRDFMSERGGVFGGEESGNQPNRARD